MTVGKELDWQRPSQDTITHPSWKMLSTRDIGQIIRLLSASGWPLDEAVFHNLEDVVSTAKKLPRILAQKYNLSLRQLQPIPPIERFELITALFANGETNPTSPNHSSPTTATFTDRQEAWIALGIILDLTQIENESTQPHPNQDVPDNPQVYISRDGLIAVYNPHVTNPNVTQLTLFTQTKDI